MVARLLAELPAADAAAGSSVLVWPDAEVVVVREAGRAFPRSAARWRPTRLPVPADVLVYTLQEWQRLDGVGRFGRGLARVARWLYVRD